MQIRMRERITGTEITNDEVRQLHEQIAAEIDGASIDQAHKEHILTLKHDPDYVKGTGIYYHLKRYQEAASEQAKEAHARLLEHHQPLAYAVVERHFNTSGRRVEPADLNQEAWAALSLSIWKFQPERGFQFSTYTYGRIAAHVSRYMSRADGVGAAPPHIVDAARRLRKDRPELAGVGQLADSRTDLIAEHFRSDIRFARNIVRFLASFHDVRSLDESFGRAHPEYVDNEGQPTVRRRVGNIEDQLLSNAYGEMEEELFWSLMSAEITDAALSLLDERERMAVELRMGFIGGDKLIYDAVGEALGVTGERARKIVKSAIDKLRFSDLFTSAQDIEDVALVSTRK